MNWCSATAQLRWWRNSTWFHWNDIVLTFLSNSAFFWRTFHLFVILFFCFHFISQRFFRNGYVCNFLIRSLGIFTEIVPKNKQFRTNDRSKTELQRLIKSYLHYVGSSDLITNKFLLIDALEHIDQTKKKIHQTTRKLNEFSGLTIFLFIPFSRNPLILYSLNIY